MLNYIAGLPLGTEGESMRTAGLGEAPYGVWESVASHHYIWHRGSEIMSFSREKSMIERQLTAYNKFSLQRTEKEGLEKGQREVYALPKFTLSHSLHSLTVYAHSQFMLSPSF